MLIAAGLLLLVVLTLVSAHGVVQATWFAAVVDRVPTLRWLGTVAARWASTLLFTGIVGLVYYFVPNTRVRFQDVWFGACVTGVLWHWALRGFSWYVGDYSRFSVHGSIAAVIVFLLWIQISAIVFLYGVEVTSVYARLRHEHRGDTGAV
jgi:membrane protein